MNSNNYIQIAILCRHYEIAADFFQHLDELGLIEVVRSEEQICVDEAQIRRIDKIVRLHHDLEINPEGIDVVLNLLRKIEQLEESLNAAKNRLALHE